ncbi:MAG: hypothetical protein U9O78_05030 [Patescibacteria group bacterium]|nr:hypothetical protein [Patescibacteria group bacterium]
MNNKFSQQLKKIKSQSNLLLMLVFAFVGVIVWIGGTIFVSSNKTELTGEVRSLARPLIPSFKVEVFSRIEEKRSYSEEELENFPIYKIEENREQGGFQVMTIDGRLIEVDEEDSGIETLINNRANQATESSGQQATGDLTSTDSNSEINEEL